MYSSRRIFHSALIVIILTTLFLDTVLSNEFNMLCIDLEFRECRVSVLSATRA